MRSSSWWIVVALSAVVFAALVSAVRADDTDSAPKAAIREISGGVVAGGVVAIAVVVFEDRRESRRDSADTRRAELAMSREGDKALLAATFSLMRSYRSLVMSVRIRANTSDTGPGQLGLAFADVNHLFGEVQSLMSVAPEGELDEVFERLQVAYDHWLNQPDEDDRAKQTTAVMQQLVDQQIAHIRTTYSATDQRVMPKPSLEDTIRTQEVKK